MSEKRLVETHPVLTGERLESLKNIHDSSAPIGTNIVRISEIPNSKRILMDGLNLHFYTKEDGIITEVLPHTVDNNENTNVRSNISPNGKYVVSYRRNGSAFVFDGQTGEPKNIEIAPNSVGPKVLKKFEAESASAQELELKKNEYCGIQHVSFSPKGRYAIITHLNDQSRIFDLKKGEYSSQSFKTYSEKLQFDIDGKAIYGCFEADDKKQYIQLEYDQEEDQQETNSKKDSVAAYGKMTAMGYELVVSQTTDVQESPASIILPGCKSGEVKHNRFVIGKDEGINKGVKLVHDTATGKTTTIYSEEEHLLSLIFGEGPKKGLGYVANATVSVDGRFLYYTTTADGKEPLHYSALDSRGFLFKVAEIETLTPIEVPEVKLATDRIDSNVIVRGEHEVLVKQLDGSVAQIDVKQYADNPEVKEFMEKNRGMVPDILRAFRLMEERGVLGNDEQKRALWAQFINGASGLSADMLKDAVTLHHLQYFDGGNAVSSAPQISLIHLYNTGKLEYTATKEPAPASYESQRRRVIPFVPKRTMKMFDRAESVDLFGRTIVVSEQDRVTAIKIQRQYEYLGLLSSEGAQMQFLNKVKSELGLLTDFPTPLFNHAQYLRRIQMDSIPADIRSHIQEQNIAGNSEYGVALLYDAPKNYFTYYRELDDTQAADSTEKTIHDLFKLARFGYIHPDLIELFHNQIQAGRPDGGKYVWNVDIVRPMVTRYGAGRLHGWQRTVDYPNFGPSGLRDFAEVGHMSRLFDKDLDGAHVRHMRSDLIRLPEDLREKIVMQNFMGNYMISWVLAEGRRLVDKDGGFTQDAIGPLADRVKNAYEIGFRAYTGGKELEDALGGEQVIDWMRLSKQMHFSMGGEYAKITGFVPNELYGRRLRISRGDGWGYVHKDLLVQELEQSGIPDTEGFIAENFRQAQSRRRQVPANILRFQYEPENTDQKPHPIVAELFAKYGSGMRANGRDEDLGPMNGPLPIPEVITANYLMTTAAIAEVTQ